MRALVTGGAKRLGKEIAIFLAERGFEVAIHYHSSESNADKLVEYIKSIRNFKKIKKGHEDTLFINNRGQKLTRVMIYTILNNLANHIGLKKKISPHVLRHSFATHLIENGADIISIQKMMGHENIVTTEKYLHVKSKHLIDSVLKYHPRS